MTREEPSLETLWLQNIRTMDEVRIIDHSNTAPSSKTFRDELNQVKERSCHYVCLFDCPSACFNLRNHSGSFICFGVKISTLN
jgi:hypothetical protein